MNSQSENFVIPDLLATYPRLRPPLPDEWKEIYVKTYKESRDGETLLYRLTQYLESWMHRKVTNSNHTLRLLELGAGTLNHVPYETTADRYDIVEPFRELYSDKPSLAQINDRYDDIFQIPLTERYDQIASIATLEHITNLPEVIARAGLLLENGGRFSAGIPSEGGLLWGLSWRMSVGLVARLKYGLDYGDLMRHEHVNSAPEILSLVKYFFRSCNVVRFPLPFHGLSLYACIQASDPIPERCEEYGNNQGTT